MVIVFKNSSKTIRCAGVAAITYMSIVALAACSSAHEVIDSGKACTSCHSDTKQTYEVANPSGAISSNGSITVKTSASTVVVCKPTFISEDGSRFVPMQYSSKTVSDGSTEITLDEGAWALCTVDGVSVKASKIVVVSASGDAAVEVNL